MSQHPGGGTPSSFGPSPDDQPEDSRQSAPPPSPPPAGSDRGDSEPILLLPPGRPFEALEPGVAAAGAEAAAEVGVLAPPKERVRWGPRLRRLARELVETVILALLIFLAVRAVVQNFRVEGKSMEPGLEDGQYLLINKAIYFKINLETVSKFLPFIDPGDHPLRHLFRAPRRGDVVVFRFPKDPERDYIKRIIGEPGDVVAITGGVVSINGAVIDEPYVVDKGDSNFGPTTVPEDHYFVLGDNRRNSSDSRSWGMLPEENIIGQAWISYWPSSSWGLVNNTHPKLQPQAP